MEPDRELEVSGQLGIPAVARLGIRYKRAWVARTTKYMDDVYEISGLDEGAVDDRLDATPELTEILGQGVLRAGAVDSPEYRRALAQLAAAALTDIAAIDAVALLHAQVLLLQPAHLRVLAALRKTPGAQSGEPGKLDEPPRDGHWVNDFSEMLTTTRLPHSAVLGLLQGLQAVGLVRREFAAERPGGIVELFNEDSDTPWSITPWGEEALLALAGSI